MLDWDTPWTLLLAPVLCALAWFWRRRSLHPMSPTRQRAALLFRGAGLTALLLALAGPAIPSSRQREAVVLIFDHSQSQGAQGLSQAVAAAKSLLRERAADVSVGVVSTGSEAKMLLAPRESSPDFDAIGKSLGLTTSASPRSGEKSPSAWVEQDGGQSDLAAGVDLALAAFPAGWVKRAVLFTDGLETQGSLREAAKRAAVSGVRLDALPIAGPVRPDARVRTLIPGRTRLSEGAPLTLRADVESSVSGDARVRLFENGVQVAERAVRLNAGEPRALAFERQPERRGLYRYTAEVDGIPGDQLPENNSALALVEVTGQPLLLYLEGEAGEEKYLADAMREQGLRLDVRPASSLPDEAQELAGYDAVILSDVPASAVTDRQMAALRDYVESLGGGFVMIGGPHAFGAGGYYRTPIEDILPVKMRAPDKEERDTVALTLVLDRSGSMSGQKIQICKSAAIATAELLKREDYLGVVAFDSESHWVVPMTQAGEKSYILGQIAGIEAGGGTNIYPAMETARRAMAGIQAKVKHMIVLTDGQTQGGDYPALARQLAAEGVTVSTVAVGDGADLALLRTIAASGGGQFYLALDPANVPRIFTQDTMLHSGRVLREERFQPRQAQEHPMLRGFEGEALPALGGYVRTERKSTAQVPLVTPQDDPLLAHWRFGLGKVTAFASDCKSRWAAAWTGGWAGYGPFWAQILRETARPPQGRNADLRVTRDGGLARVELDLRADATHFRDGVEAEAEVFRIATGGTERGLERLARLELEQVGPGRYTGGFAPDRSGLYLVCAHAAGEVLQAGFAHNPSREAATGQVRKELLQEGCAITGGTLLRNADTLPRHPAVATYDIDLEPWLLQLGMILILIDLAIRRWENVHGLLRIIRHRKAS